MALAKRWMAAERCWIAKMNDCSSILGVYKNVFSEQPGQIQACHVPVSKSDKQKADGAPRVHNPLGLFNSLAQKAGTHRQPWAPTQGQCVHSLTSVPEIC